MTDLAVDDRVVVSAARLSRLRRAISAALVDSWTTAVPVTLHTRLDVARDLARGVAIDGLLVRLARQLSASALNGSLIDETLTEYSTVHLAYALDTPRGLVAPIVRDAASLSLDELRTERRRVADAAFEGSLASRDLEGATFTVTNLGTFGVEYFTPIIVRPQLGILALGALDRERQELPVSLTFDHRAIDGAGAARFLQGLSAPASSID